MNNEELRKIFKMLLLSPNFVEWCQEHYYAVFKSIGTTKYENWYEIVLNDYYDYINQIFCND